MFIKDIISCNKLFSTSFTTSKSHITPLCFIADKEIEAEKTQVHFLLTRLGKGVQRAPCFFYQTYVSTLLGSGVYR